MDNQLNALCNEYGVAEYSGDNYYYDDIFNNHNQNDLIFTCLMIAINIVFIFQIIFNSRYFIIFAFMRHSYNKKRIFICPILNLQGCK